MDVLHKSTDAMETVLVLNTVVLLQDGKPGYKFTIKAEDILKTDHIYVAWRMEYLEGKIEK